MQVERVRLAQFVKNPSIEKIKYSQHEQTNLQKQKKKIEVADIPGIMYRLTEDPVSNLMQKRPRNPTPQTRYRKPTVSAPSSSANVPEGDKSKDVQLRDEATATNDPSVSGADEGTATQERPTTTQSANSGKVVASPVTLPDEAELGCMCYEKLMETLIQNYVQSPKLYRTRQPTPLELARPTWMRRAIESYHSNRQLQYPMSTVIVRWQLKRHVPNYKRSIVQSEMARFGHMTRYQPLGPNSCVVVYESLSSACRAIECKAVGYPDNRLIVGWWHKVMDNKSVLMRAKGVAVRSDPYKPVKSGW